MIALWQRYNTYLVCRCIRVSIALLLGVWIYHHFSLLHGVWVPLTIFILMQDTTGSTVRKGIMRLIGTVIGIVLGTLLAQWLHMSIFTVVAFVLITFITYYCKAFRLVNYVYFIWPFTMMVVFILALVVPEQAEHLVMARLVDTLVGAAIAIMATFLIFPRNLTRRVELGMTDVVRHAGLYLGGIINVFMKRTDAVKHCLEQKQQFLVAMGSNRQYFNDWLYEIHFHKTKRQMHADYIEQSEKLGQCLQSFHAIARMPWPDEWCEQLAPMLQSLDDKVKRLVGIIVMQRQHAPMADALVRFDDELEHLRQLYAFAVDQNQPDLAGMVAILIGDVQGIEDALYGVMEQEAIQAD